MKDVGKREEVGNIKTEVMMALEIFFGMEFGSLP